MQESVFLSQCLFINRFSFFAVVFHLKIFLSHSFCMLSSWLPSEWTVSQLFLWSWSSKQEMCSKVSLSPPRCPNKKVKQSSYVEFRLLKINQSPKNWIKNKACVYYCLFSMWQSFRFLKVLSYTYHSSFLEIKQIRFSQFFLIKLHFYFSAPLLICLFGK